MDRGRHPRLAEGCYRQPDGIAGWRDGHDQAADDIPPGPADQAASASPGGFGPG